MELNYHEEEPMIQHKTSCIKHGVIEQLAEVYSALCSCLAKCCKTNSTALHMQMDNDPKHAVKAAQDVLNAKKWGILK